MSNEPKKNIPASQKAEEFTLESILAEYGPGAAEPAPRTRDLTPRPDQREHRSAPHSRLQESAHSRLRAPSRAEASREEVGREKTKERKVSSGKNKISREKTSKKSTEDLSDTRRFPVINQPLSQQEPTPVEHPKKLDENPCSPYREQTSPEIGATEELSPDKVRLRDVMRQTVDSAMAENEDGILEPSPTLKERWQKILSAVTHRRIKAPAPQDTERLWTAPLFDEPIPKQIPEPDRDDALRREKRRSKHRRHRLILSSVPTLVLVVLSVLDLMELLPSLWWNNQFLRGGVLAGLLCITALFCDDVWHVAGEKLKNRQLGAEFSALLTTMVVLADCVYRLVSDNRCGVPFAASAAVMLWLCQWGLYLDTNARREAFQMASVCGVPQYVASLCAAGICRQKGVLSGFYHRTDQKDPTVWQNFAVPMIIGVSMILAGYVALTRACMDRILWTWSALLCAGLPLSLALQYALPMARLQHRLSRSGSALAGFAGARLLSRSRRIVVTEGELFPPGTVAFNGYKVIGEERQKMLSYAAAVTREAHSQLSPLFAQQLDAEGGYTSLARELQFYEDGGVSAVIRGETVLMGSGYFMNKRHVSVPSDLKLKTGVYLAVDGVLGAVFVIKYQPSRNVEWALRAMRRCHMQPVMAVRSGNVTPGLLRRKFHVDCKPIYPDVTTRLALSDAMEQHGEVPNALFYREGLMPLVETAVGSRHLVSTVRWNTVLSCISAAVGLFLAWYFTSGDSFSALSPLYMLAYGLLWLVPTVLMSGSVKHF